MRSAVIITLQALYECKEVTAKNSIECDTTRVSNEILTLRNTLGVEIATDRITTINRKWYGSYRLIRTDENLKKVREILEKYSNSNETSMCKY